MGLNLPFSNAVNWIEAKIANNLEAINHSYDKFRISEALMSSYKTVWDDFCSWFLEMVKPSYGHPIDLETYNSVINVFESILKIIHPLTPFISEEIWHQLNKRKNGEYIVNAKWPSIDDYDENIILECEK